MRLLDGGFESGGTDTPWTLDGGADFVQDPHPVHAGQFSMDMQGGQNPFGGYGSYLGQAIATTPGELIAVSGWFYADAQTLFYNRPLRLAVDTDPGDGTNFSIAIKLSPLELGALTWMPHILDPFTAASSRAYLQWSSEPQRQPVPAFWHWYLDNLQVVGDDDMAKRSRWLAHARLIQVLKGINGVGGGYHTDLGSRVYQKYIRPVGSTHPKLPYICVPLVNTAPQLEHVSPTWFRHTWTLPVMAFVAESNVGAYESAAIEALYHLGEDVYRAVMQDPTLSGTAQEVTFLSGALEEGGISPFDGLPYADAVIPIQLSIVFGLDVLGP